MKLKIMEQMPCIHRSKIYTITTLILSFLFISSTLNAQKLIDDTKTLKVLVFEHEQKDKKKLISQTGRIKYKLRSTNKVYKGTLDDIKDGSMVVDGNEIAFSDCIWIGGRVTSEETLIGGIGIGMGFTTLLMSTGLILGAVPIGGVVAVMVVGVGALITGIALITKIKRFNLDKGWAVYNGKIEYNPTQF